MTKVQTLLAPNPGPFTGPGTNTYLLGQDRLVIVDPGPDLPAHEAALLEALAGRPVEAILVTHAHLDHSALAPALAARLGAPVLAFGGASAGLSPAMRALAAQGLTGGEGADRAFVPDQTLTEGQALTLAGLEIEVLHTPGHMGNHLCFALGDLLMSGDHVMGWSSSIVSPPEGDMGDYIASLRKLATRTWGRLLPGHGPEVAEPAARLAALLDHRLAREAAILQALRAQGPASAETLALRLYTDTPAALLPAASRNVLAHLIDLQGRGAVAPQPAPPEAFTEASPGASPGQVTPLPRILFHLA